jgi:hypothetical protein
MNNYRLEFTPGVDCKFYLNGVLVGTHTTNLPPAANTGVVNFGAGLDDDGGALDGVHLSGIAVNLDF